MLFLKSISAEDIFFWQRGGEALGGSQAGAQGGPCGVQGRSPRRALGSGTNFCSHATPKEGPGGCQAGAPEEGQWEAERGAPRKGPRQDPQGRPAGKGPNGSPKEGPQAGSPRKASRKGP